MPLNFTTEKNGSQKADSVSPNPASQPEFRISVPRYSFDDLILPKDVTEELNTVVSAGQYWDIVFTKWNLRSVMKDKKNLFVNLYGEPGTGKTMAAHAVAHALQKNILCVNYADVESKYVGETGKNLIALFKFAESRDAIIFFDEADALLSRRVTNMNSATDVSVNQTRSVLLTLLNDYTDMVIFASNFISNYDPAFMRRIQYHVRFRLPDQALREKLWKKYIPDEMPADLNISEISRRFEGISGSDISNAMLKAALRAAKNREERIRHQYFCDAIQSIIDSKNANLKNEHISVTEREVSKEYYKEKVKGAVSPVNLKKQNYGGKE